MEAKINYEGKPVRFIGRNGYLKQSGIYVYANESLVILQPITSKGEVGRCSMEIPIEYVAALVNILSDAAGLDD